MINEGRLFVLVFYFLRHSGAKQFRIEKTNEKNVAVPHPRSASASPSVPPLSAIQLPKLDARTVKSIMILLQCIFKVR